MVQQWSNDKAYALKKWSLNGIMNAMEQFQAINPNPVLRVSNDGMVIYSNEAGEPLLQEWGVKLGEKLPSSIGDLVQRVISQNSPEKMEAKVGNKVYLIVFSPLPEQECVTISGFDIADCMRAEEKTRWNEVRLVEAQRLAKVGSWEWDIVKDNIVWSEQMYKTLGRSPELQPPRYNEHSPYFTLESWARLDSVVMKALEFGEPFELELEHIREDCIHGWMIARGEAVPDNEGNIIKLRGTVQDITERKRAEQKLRESEERFRSAFDDSAVAMALVCPDARFLKVNDEFCQLLGFEKSEMEGSTFLDFTYPNDMEPSILIHKAVINREKPFFWLEKRYIRKDGRVIWCEVSSSPVFDSKGCPIYTVAHVQDITERKEAEEALKKAHNTLEEKVKERTAELEEAYKSLKESEERLAEAQKMAHIGNWERNFAINELHWSDEMYRIFGLNPQEFEVTYDAFLSYVHPDDRDYVDNAFKEALNGKPFDIDLG